MLNAFCILDEAHLNYILRVAQDWYNFRRGHSGREKLPTVRDAESPVVVDFAKDSIVCREELGGHLKSYHRAAWRSLFPHRRASISAEPIEAALPMVSTVSNL